MSQAQLLTRMAVFKWLSFSLWVSFREPERDMREATDYPLAEGEESQLRWWG